MSKTNHVQLIGNLGNDPKLISNSQNTSIIGFSMATQENYKNERGEKQQKTDWHNIVAFGKIADLMLSSLKKGSKIMLQGRLQTRQYQAKDGQDKFVTEIVTEEFLYLDKLTNE